MLQHTHFFKDFPSSSTLDVVSVVCSNYLQRQTAIVYIRYCVEHVNFFGNDLPTFDVMFLGTDGDSDVNVKVNHAKLLLISDC